MKCPFWQSPARQGGGFPGEQGGDAIRRRGMSGCDRRFTTYERIDEVPYMVSKKDGRREKFDRQKVLTGLLKALKNARGHGQASRPGQPRSIQGKRFTGS